MNLLRILKPTMVIKLRNGNFYSLEPHGYPIVDSNIELLKFRNINGLFKTIYLDEYDWDDMTMKDRSLKLYDIMEIHDTNFTFNGNSEPDVSLVKVWERPADKDEGNQQKEFATLDDFHKFDKDEFEYIEPVRIDGKQYIAVKESYFVDKNILDINGNYYDIKLCFNGFHKKMVDTLLLAGYPKEELKRPNFDAEAKKLNDHFLQLYKERFNFEFIYF